MGARKTAPRGTGVEAIWAELGTSLDRFVRRHIADPHAADDVVAEVLGRIHEHLGTVDDRERVSAWVWRITRNAITDHHRRTARRREVPGLEDEAVVDASADRWIDDQDAVARDFASSCIRPLVDALPTDYRRALQLTDLGGRTQAEAARIEGVSVSGMKSRVQRARRRVAALGRECCEVTTDSRGALVDFRPHASDRDCACR